MLMYIKKKKYAVNDLIAKFTARSKTIKATPFNGTSEPVTGHYSSKWYFKVQRYEYFMIQM